MLDEKERLLRATGVDEIAVLPFTLELSRLTAKEFMQEVLAREFCVRALVLGYDHAFGHGGGSLDDYEGISTFAKVRTDSESISLNRDDITMSFRGETFTFTAVVYPSSAQSAIVWTSSNDDMVTVSQDGTVNARSGTGNDYVLITATCGDKSASCIVRCSFETADEILALSAEDVTLFYANETATLSVTSDLTDAEKAQVLWATSNPAVVAVDQSGRITAMSGGTATITATYGQRVGKCIVRCNFGSPTVSTSETTTPAAAPSNASYSLTYTDVTLFHAGESFTLGITASEGEVPDHTWSTSDASICTVDANGVVTAVGGGTASVLTTVDGKLLQCVVRVSISD